MGIFDSDFDIENYIRKRIPKLDNPENRELFKAIVGNSTLELYRHIKSEYDALEKITDSNLFPIFPEDLNKVEINAPEMIYNVKNGRNFF